LRRGIFSGIPVDFNLTTRAATYSQTRSKENLNQLVPLWTNWDYRNWRLIWRAIRHAMVGEVEVKRHASEYLPKPEGMDDEQFSAYLDRAVFYNMVYRTVTGLTGAIYRRPPRLLKCGPKLRKLNKRISKDGLSLLLFSKVITQEMLSVGRYGVLADKPESNDPLAMPYLAGYTCENILDWTQTEVDGRDEFDYILLREFRTDRRLFVFEGNDAKPNPAYGNLFISYRALRLEFNDAENRWEYFQEVYARDSEDANLTETPVRSTPLIYGTPMTRIPFRFFNATTNLGDVEKPPILDILTLNLSHYKTYAQLEHGRFYTANPVYYVSGGSEESEYHIGPSVVWEIGQQEKAGIIEFNGQGLRSLEKALDTKESQVASLGGRLIGDSNTAGQSDNQTKLKDRNEQSLLLNVTTVLNENFTDLLKVVAEWINEKSDDLEFRANQDFLLDQAAAREFRAITMMYQEGLLPIEVIYEFFLKADVIPEYVTIEMFVKMLEDAAQFPNNPDFLARQDGFPDRQSQIDDELARDGLDQEDDQHGADLTSEADLLDTELEHNASEAAKARKAAATQQPAIPPVPGQAKDAMNAEGQGGKPAPAKRPVLKVKPKKGGAPA
jgi:hypothetical protein